MTQRERHVVEINGVAEVVGEAAVFTEGETPIDGVVTLGHLPLFGAASA